MDKVERLLSRRVAKIYPNRKALGNRLKSGKRLRVYLGIDPTSTKLHLGNAIPLWKLQEFAAAGHEAVLLIGDFTALIGDPSDKDKTRPVLSPEEIKRNFATWKKQASKILDFKKVKVKQNSQWLGKLTLADILKLATNFTVQQMLERERFRVRLKKKLPIQLQEFLYPLMQGYDSVAMDVDVEIGGEDQTFNMLAGRTLMKKLKDKEKLVLTTVFPLVGTDGRKMSKSYGNGIYLDDEPKEMFGKAMRIEDELLEVYIDWTTNWEGEKLSEMKRLVNFQPMEAKKKLAEELVRMYHGEEESKKAKESFERVFQERKLPQVAKKLVVKRGEELAEALVRNKIIKSKSEAKRLVRQKGVEMEGKTIGDWGYKVGEKDGGRIVKIGKRKFVRLVLK